VNGNENGNDRLAGRTALASAAVAIVMAMTVGMVVGCGDEETTLAPETVIPPSLLVGKTSDFLATADWNNAVTQTVTLREVSPSQFEFDPKNLVLEAGTPVVLTIVNPSTNSSKHYYTATDFYKSVAWRKAQTPDAEYKAPYFNAFELKTGASATQIELYFVPVETGTFPVICTIPGHYDLGMSGFITVTGNSGNAIDQDISTTWNSALESDPRTSGGDPVWVGATTPTIDITETPFTFSPLNLALTINTGYKLLLTNVAANTGPHYYTAGTFYQTCVTRKADDANAEIKVPYFNAVELRNPGTAGTSTTLFLVPTGGGVFSVTCTITGHRALGMDGTITVQ